MVGKRSNRRVLHFVGAWGGQKTSSKYYAIGRLGSDVHVKHGRADFRNGKLVVLRQQKRVLSYSSAASAEKAMLSKIDSKLSRGYQETPVKMRPKLNIFAPQKMRKATKKRITSGELVRQIRKVENFQVELLTRKGKSTRKVRSDRGGFLSYRSRFVRRLGNDRSISDWKRLRFDKEYPADIIVRAVDGLGDVVPDSRKLKGLRKSYA